MASPENVKGWLGAIWPTLQQATPVSMLFMVLAGAFIIWHLLGQIEQERERSSRLAQFAIETKEAHLELALRCARTNGLRE